MTGNGSDRVRFGPFEVDLHTHELWKYGTRIRLVGQPFEILALLLSKPGELVTREELRGRLWPGDTFVDFNHGLNAAVNKLREVLSDSAESPRYIETLPRRGYRFIAIIEPRIAPAARPAPTSPIEQSAGIPPKPEFAGVSLNLKNEAETANAQVAESRRGLRYLVRGGAVLLLLLGSVFLLKIVSGHGQGSDLSRPMERLRPLTMPIESSGGPAFSPDGNYVAFERRGAKPGDAGIYVKATEGDQMMQLTSSDDDCCPVWSPDGRSIAFSRFANKGFAIYVVPSEIGGGQKQEAERKESEKKITTKAAAYVLSPARTGERRLDTSDVTPRHGELNWSPDGKSIVFTAEAGILVLSLENSSLHRLTEPPPLAQDWGPSFSPDGQKLLFVRGHQVGQPDEIMVTSAAGGNATRMLSEPGQVEGPPQWSFDGRSVIFSSNRNGHPGLWRVSVGSPDSPVPITDPATSAWSPAVSRRGYRLAYTRQTQSLSIWQMDLSTSGDKRAHVLVPSTSQTDQGPGPQYSPDGKKLAYMSDRSGTMEIWVSDRDGTNPFQLTAVAGAGTPRWSPDSQAVVFDAHDTVVSIKVGGGGPQVLMHDTFQNLCPSWSRDGKWIYFASTRSGTFQVWKVPAEGGSPLQVTRRGGHAALESPDGKYVYYAKHNMADPEIWEVPVDGGLETPLPLVRPGTWASWQVVKHGIVFVGPSLGHKAVLSFFDFAKRRTSTIAVLDLVPFWLGATQDGEVVAFDQPGREQAQIMLVENFR